MSERFCGPTATKMATISHSKAASATPRETKNLTIQPQKLTRAHAADEGCRWFGENPPDRSRDLTISTRQPPNRRKSATSSWSKPLGTIESPADECNGLEPLAPSNGGDLEMPEEPRTQGHLPKPPRIERRLRVDLPPHIQEGDGHVTRGTITPSPDSRSQSTFEQWGPLPVKACAPRQGNGEPAAFLSMESILKEGNYNKTHAWRLSAKATICICNRQKKTQQSSKAMEQITLLRRCFFPRRDVIKWKSKPPSRRWR